MNSERRRECPACGAVNVGSLQLRSVFLGILLLGLVFAVGRAFYLSCRPIPDECVPTVSVSGVITVDGKPLAGRFVVVTQKFEWTDSAVTTVDGKYKLRAQSGENVLALTACDDPNDLGSHKVKQHWRDFALHVPVEGTDNADLELVTDVETVPVSGTITLSGRPLRGCKVSFYGSTHFRRSTTTSRDGTYEISVEPGENMVECRDCAAYNADSLRAGWLCVPLDGMDGANITLTSDNKTDPRIGERLRWRATLHD